LGASAFDLILDYEDVIDSGAIVEIGSSRGDGSTHFFAGYVSNNNKFNFYSVDINEELTRHLTKFERVKYSNIKILTGKGEEKLDEIDGPISYAYLDNFDLIRPGTEKDSYIVEQIQKYKKDFDIEMNNENCYHAHLLQAQKINLKCSNKCIIQIDDTHLSNNEWVGKGKTAVPWLLNNGWKVLPQHKDRWTNTDYVALGNWL
jgi:hypothetical protein